MGFQRSETYSPRPIRLIELLEHDGWRFKLYAITYRAEAFDRASFDSAMLIALKELPSPAITAQRPGVGFMICHRGRGWDYLVVCWWDNQNELPMHIYVRPRDASVPWRRARDSESICVWDLQVINFERDAYVREVLAAEQSVDCYLARSLYAD